MQHYWTTTVAHLQRNNKLFFGNYFCVSSPFYQSHDPYISSLSLGRNEVIDKKPKANTKKYSKSIAFCLLLCGKKTQKRFFSVLFPEQPNDLELMGVAKIRTTIMLILWSVQYSLCSFQIAFPAVELWELV